MARDYSHAENLGLGREDDASDHSEPGKAPTRRFSHAAMMKMDRQAFVLGDDRVTTVIGDQGGGSRAEVRRLSGGRDERGQNGAAMASKSFARRSSGSQTGRSSQVSSDSSEDDASDGEFEMDHMVIHATSHPPAESRRRRGISPPTKERDVNDEEGWEQETIDSDESEDSDGEGEEEEQDDGSDDESEDEPPSKRRRVAEDDRQLLPSEIARRGGSESEDEEEEEEGGEGEGDEDEPDDRAFQSILEKHLAGVAPGSVASKGRYFTAATVDAGLSLKCFNCGEAGHFASQCPKGVIPKPCFLCGGTSHLANRCERARELRKQSRGQQRLGPIGICALCGSGLHETARCDTIHSELHLTTCLETGVASGAPREVTVSPPALPPPPSASSANLFHRRAPGVGGLFCVHCGRPGHNWYSCPLSSTTRSQSASRPRPSPSPSRRGTPHRPMSVARRTFHPPRSVERSPFAQRGYPHAPGHAPRGRKRSRSPSPHRQRHRGGRRGR